jgi:protein-disulfide isomerase
MDRHTTDCKTLMSMLHPNFRTDYDHFQGSPIAPIELVEYGDFQCNHCGEVYVTIKMLQDCFGDLLRFVYRHFPIPDRHPLSLPAAVAAEAASLQGKFWYMHDMIYENQQYLTRASFSCFANDLQLDTTEFDDCREHRKLIRKVFSDFEGGLKSGVTSSPMFFINGTRFEGFTDFDTMYLALKYANHPEFGIAGSRETASATADRLNRIDK